MSYEAFLIGFVGFLGAFPGMSYEAFLIGFAGFLKAFPSMSYEGFPILFLSPSSTNNVYLQP